MFVLETETKLKISNKAFRRFRQQISKTTNPMTLDKSILSK